MATEAQENASRLMLGAAGSLWDDTTVRSRLFVLLATHPELDVAELTSVLAAIRRYRPKLYPPLVNQIQALHTALLSIMPRPPPET